MKLRQNNIKIQKNIKKKETSTHAYRRNDS